MKVHTKERRNNIKVLDHHYRKEFRRQNEARKLIGLPQLKIKIRTCVLCHKPFESTGSWASCKPDYRKPTHVLGYVWYL